MCAVARDRAADRPAELLLCGIRPCQVVQLGKVIAVGHRCILELPKRTAMERVVVGILVVLFARTGDAAGYSAAD
jgi:hypothetical protein